MIAGEQPEDFAPDWTVLPIDLPDELGPQDGDGMPVPLVPVIAAAGFLGVLCGAFVTTAVWVFLA